MTTRPFFPQGSKDRAESQAKENDTQSVGTIPVSQGLTIVRILGVGRLERGQEKVVWKQISAQIHEIIHDIHFPFLSVSIPQNGFGFGVARVHGQNQNQADDSGNQ